MLSSAWRSPSCWFQWRPLKHGTSLCDACSQKLYNTLCVCMSVCVRECLWERERERERERVHVCVCVWMYAQAHVCVCMCVHVCVRASICMCVPKSVGVRMHVCGCSACNESIKAYSCMSFQFSKLPLLKTEPCWWLTVWLQVTFVDIFWDLGLHDIQLKSAEEIQLIGSFEDLHTREVYLSLLYKSVPFISQIWEFSYKLSVRVLMSAWVWECIYPCKNVHILRSNFPFFLSTFSFFFFIPVSCARSANARWSWRHIVKR